MGIPTLITTNTEDDDATSSFTSGIDGTYDEYMFVFTDINPATDTTDFTFQVSTDGGSSYGIEITSTFVLMSHDPGSDATAYSYQSNYDLIDSTSFCPLARTLGGGASESCAGILHLFAPSSTTYVKHWYADFQAVCSDPQSYRTLSSGHVNSTGDVDAIQFKMASGNLDGVIQMYGIA